MYIISLKFTYKYFTTLYIKSNIFTYINKIRMIKYLLPLFIINMKLLLFNINKFRL